MVTVHVFRVLSVIWQHFQLPTGQMNTKIRHCIEAWIIRAITPLSLGPLVHSFCRAMAKHSSYLPLHVCDVQLHSSASHRPVAHERWAGHDLQHQSHPSGCSEQWGTPPPHWGVRLCEPAQRYGNMLPPTAEATQTLSSVLMVILP